MSPRLRSAICLFLILATVLISPSLAQEIPTNVNAQNRTGDLPYSTAVGTDVEHVDMASGNLIVNIPFASIPGRGMNYNFGLQYNGLFWVAAPRISSFGDREQWKLEDRGYTGIAG